MKSLFLDCQPGDNAADFLYVGEPEPADWPLFNAIELAPVESAPDGIVEVIEEHQIGSDPAADYFWAVYMRLDCTLSENGEFGGAVCVADVRTKEAAERYAEELERRLGAIVGARLIKMHTARGEQ